MSEIIVDKELFTHLTSTVDTLTQSEHKLTKENSTLKKEIVDLKSAKEICDNQIKSFEEKLEEMRLKETKEKAKAAITSYDPEYWEKGLLFWKLTSTMEKMIIQQFINKKTKQSQYKIIC